MNPHTQMLYSLPNVCEALPSPRALWMGSTSLPARSWQLRCPHFFGFLSLLKLLSGSQPPIDIRSASGIAEDGFFYCLISLWSLGPLQLKSREDGGVSHLPDHGLDVGEYEPLHDFPLSWEQAKRSRYSLKS